MLSRYRSTAPLRFVSLLLVVASLGFPGRAGAQEPVPVAPGTTYTRIYQPAGPWAINVVEIDLSEKLVELHAVLGRGDITGRQPVAQMVAAQGSGERRPVAAVNADYFALAGQGYTTLPLGFHVQNGELVTLPDSTRSVLYLLSDGTAHIDRFRSSSWLLAPGDLMYPLSGVNRPPEKGELTLLTPRFGGVTRTGETALQLTLDSLSGPPRPNGEVTGRIAGIAAGSSVPIPDDGAVLVASGVAGYALRNLKVGDQVRLRFLIEPPVAEIREAIGGGPRIVRGGAISIEHRVERFADSFASLRHPRTGVGLRDGKLLMVTVDGRQPGYSEGMTLREFAQLFLDLGCQEAMNLDGGGSTTMVVRDKIVNSPSDGAPRRVANALALFTIAPTTGTPVRLAIEPAEANVLMGERLALSAVGLDEYFNPVTLAPGSVEWQCSASLGTVDPDGMFCGAEVSWPLAGLVVAKSQDLAASTVIRVLPAPSRLAITPVRTSVRPGSTQKFMVRAYDDYNSPVLLPSSRVTWEVSPAGAGARIDANGVLRAPADTARLIVTAKLGEVSAQAEVLVGVITTTLADFEKPAVYTAIGTPDGVPVEAAVVQDPLNKVNHCLQVKYDFSTAVGTRLAQVDVRLPLPESRTISLRVLGDAQGTWLRARLRDAADRVFTVDLADRLDWAGEWRRVTGWMPEDIAQPATLESIYITEYHSDRKPAGQVCLDDIGAGSLSLDEPPPPAAGTGAPSP